VEGDTYVPGEDYRRTVTFTGFPIPTLTVIAPAGAVIENNAEIVYAVPDPAPETFTVTVQLDNGVGEPVQASWPVKKRERGLQGLWCLEEGEGDVVTDSQGSNDGTLVGDPDWTTATCPDMLSGLTAWMT